MYYEGKGVKKNLSKAKYYYDQDCKNGHKRGCDVYKILNENGIP